VHDADAAGAARLALDQLRAMLIDLDGVLYVEDEPIASAREAVERLRAAGLALRFVTNTTARSRSHTLQKLGRLGFAARDEELVTPAALAVAHCAGTCFGAPRWS
jgi:ribonucleotide monophosphatase NagD (HAD superfamily)